MKKGISLLSLIVTIIVLMILVTMAVLRANSITEDAQLAAFYNDISTVQDAVTLKMLNNMTEYANDGKNLKLIRWIDVVNAYDMEQVDDEVLPIFDKAIGTIFVAPISQEIAKNISINEDRLGPEGEFFVSSKGVVYHKGFLYNGATYYTQLDTTELMNSIVAEVNVVSPASGTYGADQLITIELVFKNEVYGDAIETEINSSTAPVLSMKFGFGTPRNATFVEVNGNKLVYTITSAVGDNGRLSLNNSSGTVYYEHGNSIDIPNILLGGNTILISTQVIGEINTDWYTELTDLYIYTVSELNGFCELMKDGYDFAGKTIHIMNDLRVNEGIFKNIGGTWYYYIDDINKTPVSSLISESIIPWISGVCRGTINGHGHTIQGLYIRNSGISTFVYGATKIENLIIANSYIVSTAADAYTMLAGIINCCGSSQNYIGGLYAGGFGNRGQFYNTYNTSMILATNHTTGGPGGIARDFMSGNIVNCYNTGTIGSTSRVGGIAGTGGFNTTYMYNVYNTGTVYGSYSIGYAIGYKFYGICSYAYGINNGLSVYGGSEGGMTFSNYSVFNTSQVLSTAINVNGITTNSLITALNQYVQANRNSFSCALVNWVEDTNNINGGYPIFEWQVR